MNAGLLNIVKHIVAQYGESILNDPARLKPLIKHQAQNVPQEERRAFGRAVEQGFYRKLKRTAARDRPRVKAALVLRLKAFTGLDAPRCAAAVDILDAVTVPVPKTPRPIKWRIAAPGAAIVIIACLIAAKELYAGRSRLHNGAAAHTPREGVIPQYAREEALRFTAAFLTENAASAADYPIAFFTITRAKPVWNTR